MTKKGSKRDTPSDGPADKTQEPNIIINRRLIIVGIGASAGGLKALEQFFSSMPAQKIWPLDMAFVIVAHLDPDHASLLPDLLQKKTQMEVFQVQDGMQVEPHSVYIIPPNKDMAILHGTLQLMEPVKSILYWGDTARKYFDEIYSIKEIIP
jgi:two-component system CheB/CheR fusion protein